MSNGNNIGFLWYYDKNCPISTNKQCRQMHISKRVYMKTKQKMKVLILFSFYLKSECISWNIFKLLWPINNIEKGKLIIVDMAASWKKEMLVFWDIIKWILFIQKNEKKQTSMLLFLTELEKKNFKLSYNDNCCYGIFQILELLRNFLYYMNVHSNNTTVLHKNSSF